MPRNETHIKQLTKQEIERQDFVDNRIFELIQELLPVPNIIDWDIEIIGSVRETIRKEFVNRGMVDEK